MSNSLAAGCNGWGNGALCFGEYEIYKMNGKERLENSITGGEFKLR